ncbi:MAG: prepilin-type N-terminal cleavage/methylation domain-containing protein [Candidatus Desulforudis sp.]|nr:prepilin-type N-terminal cleavage/methylation domain-containing protein [Desulforudis sp.]
MLHRARRNERGFTLIELMVVVAIIAVLAAIALPRFTGQADKARESAVLAELRSMKAVVEIHYAETGKLPTPDEIQTVMNEDGINWGDLVNPWGEEYPYNYRVYVPDRYIIYTRDPAGNRYYVTDRHTPTKVVGNQPPTGYHFSGGVASNGT